MQTLNLAQRKTTPLRGDATALKTTHEAAQAQADYDRWFDAKVQASIDGIKDGTNKPYTQQEWAVRRAEIIARFSRVKVV